MITNRDPNRPVSLYFNLTNACNSACIFCASSSQNIIVRHDIPPESIIEAYDRFQLGPNDEVVLNGGEPTIYRHLPDLIRRAFERHAKVILFTNGRLLRRYEYARTLMEAGVFRLSVPLHGRFPKTHDSLTCRPGSFHETLVGIRNAYSIRAATGYPEQIELKLLAVRSALREWPAIVDLIAQEFGRPDILVMSGLHMWSTARPSYDQLAPTISEMRSYVNRALDHAVAYSMHVVPWSIPLCILSQEHLNRLKRSISRTDNVLANSIQAVYFDPNYPEGIELPDDEFREWPDLELMCRNCELLESCGPGSAFMRQILAVSNQLEI